MVLQFGLVDLVFHVMRLGRCRKHPVVAAVVLRCYWGVVVLAERQTAVVLVSQVAWNLEPSAGLGNQAVEYHLC